MAKKSMEVLRRERSVEYAKYERMDGPKRKAEARFEKALVKYELAKIARDEMYERQNQISEKIAGLNGLLHYIEFGATRFETIKSEDGYDYIRFYDDDGNEVRDPRYPKVTE